MNIEMAMADLMYARSGLNSDDVYMLNLAGYHIQQSVEKALKVILNIHNIPNIQTHDIGMLITTLKNNNIEVTAKIYKSRLELTSWETQGRYMDTFCINKSRLEKMLYIAEDFIVGIIRNYRMNIKLPRLVYNSYWRRHTKNQKRNKDTRRNKNDKGRTL